MIAVALIFAAAYTLLRLVAWLAPDDPPRHEHPRRRHYE